MRPVGAFAIAAAALAAAYAQPARSGKTASAPQYRSQEVSESDGIPVLIKHLPDWEAKRREILFATDAAGLKPVFADSELLSLIELKAGAEAASAMYPAGRLVIVEYTTPQASIDADAKITAHLAAKSDGRTAYRRIGNYNAFVFGYTDEAAANALLDQVRYEKMITWLDDPPVASGVSKAEREFAMTTSDIFLSTVLAIGLGMGVSIAGGIICGFLFFLFRERQRSRITAFSDAGGMTRLNLDGLTPDSISSKLLGD